MPETFVLVRLLNDLFMGVEAKAYQTIGVHPAEAAEKAIAVNKALGLELLVVCGLIVVFIIVRLTLSVEKPAPLQQVVEMVHEFTGGQAEQVIGHGYERFQAYATCIFLFVLINNLTGLIPGVEMATKFPWVPLGLAVLTFGYYHYQGIRANGFGYVKQFLGPMLPIEIISHCARVMSLTIRLYANMLASDLVALVFFSLVPFAVPAVFLGLHAFVACIQAYIFMLLTLIYLSQAVAHEH
jgi:F-type H+-transporting ATPase subunit a